MKIWTKILLYITLSGIALLFVMPFAYSVYYSLLPLQFIDQLVSIQHFTLANYGELFTNYPVIRWLNNTIVNTVLIVVGNVIIDCMAGYALSRLQFPGRNAIFIAVLTTMMVPYQFIITPVYIMLAKIGWVDTMWAITVPFLFNALFIFMARQFFMSIPKDLEEAARVDGLSRAGIFFRIILPLTKPIITSIVILSFTGTWNSYLIPATFISTRENFTLVVGLKTVKDLMFERMNLTLAGVVLLSLPILIVFLVLQKHFVEGIAATGVKG
ncbi:carbohydrate ABC transporter permease [Paenibacillus sp. J2TS4]|uniref:carbohydrate ABC transporter permease n=1 Tax=Paenibacillus sp. J2TS4 TaxID=2807194 RepID=UPI001B18DE52|nr:carbohydrate ABC transporter permease [Paenibacillus sp. J2TS4]GIP30969.1 ABC transporter permease [Paenibacillus sp. J2TS4]